MNSTLGIQLWYFVLNVLTYIMNNGLLTNEEFVNVASTNDIQPPQMKANVDGKYYAIIFESVSGP